MYTSEQIEKMLAYGKKPFTRLLPRRVVPPKFSNSNLTNQPVNLPNIPCEIIDQSQFLQELDPNSHRIMDCNVYPNKIVYRIDPDTEEETPDHIEEIARIPFAFQKVIKTKTVTHLTGKPLKWKLANEKPNKKQSDTFTWLKQKWLKKNMHVAFFEAVDIAYSCGDSALYFYRDNKKLNFSVWGYTKGDILIPIYDSMGVMTQFIRYFSSLDEDGSSRRCVMIIDNKTVSTYISGKKKSLKDWELVGNETNHGFANIPVCYKRTDVPHNDVQKLIEEFEWAFSSFCESNAYYAYPILFTTQDVSQMPSKKSQGKVLTGVDQNSKANFIEKQGSDTSSKIQFEYLMKMIFMGSFSVQIDPDTLKSSGDMPSSTVRLIMTPEIDKAIERSKEWDLFIDNMYELFADGIGKEFGKAVQINDLDIRLEIDIYTPENSLELVNILNSSVASKTLSRQTAHELHPYGMNDEDDRYNKEVEEEKESEIDTNDSETKEVDTELNDTNLARQLASQTK